MNASDLRRFFAEELEAVCRLQSPSSVDRLASCWLHAALCCFSAM
jgi:hypothetical protein